MTEPLFRLWAYLSATPLLGLTLTLVAYLIGDWVHRRAGRHPAVSPLLIAIALIAVLLAVTGTPYRTYFEGAQFVHFLLGPATVALGVPLYKNWPIVRRAWRAILVGVLAGSITAIVSVVGIATALGASTQTIRSLAPKSVTTPVAMGIAEKLGGLPALTAILVLGAGITGAMLGRTTLNFSRVGDWRARGLAVGAAAHGQGTAIAFQVNETAGVFASIGLALCALATSLLLPVILPWLE